MYFNTIIDFKFYNLFVDNYGKPSNRFVKTGNSSVNKSAEDDESKSLKQKLKQTFFETKEGEFEDKPSGVFLEKENYTIKIIVFYDENFSSITFARV